MPVNQQAFQPITMPVAVGLEGLEQLAHLGLGEMFTDPIGLIGPVSATALLFTAAELTNQPDSRQ